MPETFTDGNASIKLDQSTLIRQLDKVSKGAATTFVREARATTEALKVGAVARWPVATGLSRDSFRIFSRVHGDRLEVGLTNDATAASDGARYPFMLKFSVFTDSTVKRNLSEREKAVARGSTPEKRDRIGEWWDRNERLTSSTGAPSARAAGKKPWNRLVRTPGRRQGKQLAVTLRDQMTALARRG
jgi:hypothetical protein